MVAKIDIRNVATFGYLQYIQQMCGPLKDNLSQDKNLKEKPIFKTLATFISNPKLTDYDPNFSYKRLYNELHRYIEQIPLEIIDNTNSELEKYFYSLYFQSLYENDNEINKIIAKYTVNPVTPAGPTLSDKDRITQNLKTFTKSHSPKLHELKHPDNPFQKFFSGMLGFGYHPLQKNNIPYISFNHLKRKNIRMGTQINGLDNVNHALLLYLKAKQYFQAMNPDQAPKKYHHVYINLQKHLLEEQTGIERDFEAKRSMALHGIENLNLNIAVISLPADNAFFFGDFNPAKGSAKNDATRYELNMLLARIKEGIHNNKHDFYFSDSVRSELFEKNPNIIDTLFHNSIINVLGADKPLDSSVTAEQRQAILFDCIKYQLTHYCIMTLEPDTYNISCKDNIDRGGVHNLWYEMNILLDDPQCDNIDLKWFNTNFHTSALLVKERVVNHHRNVLWNTLYQSFVHNHERYNNKMPWLGEWLINNTPNQAIAQQVKQAVVPLIPEQPTLSIQAKESQKENIPPVTDGEQHKPNRRRSYALLASHRSESKQEPPLAEQTAIHTDKKSKIEIGRNRKKQ